MTSDHLDDIQPSETIIDEQPLSGWDRRRRSVALHIEEAALQLFDERGIRNVTIPDICEEASISRTTFFRYFATREDILEALPGRYFDTVSRIMLMQPPEMGIIEALCEAIRSSVSKTRQEKRMRALHQKVVSAVPASGRPVIGRSYMVQRLTAAIEQRCRDLGKPTHFASYLSAVTCEAALRTYEQSSGVSKGGELAGQLPEMFHGFANFILEDEALAVNLAAD